VDARISRDRPAFSPMRDRTPYMLHQDAPDSYSRVETVKREHGAC
jgi:hypothetical protein